MGRRRFHRRPLPSASTRRRGAARRALRIRGGGTKDFYGARLDRRSCSTCRAYAGIVAYEPQGAGAHGARGHAARARSKRRSPQSARCCPSSRRTSATAPPSAARWPRGFSGPRRPYAGAVRDFVLGTRIVNGKGEDLSFGGRVIKNVAGYDVSRLMAGALGTLGVITEISFKVLPRPRAETTLAFELDEARGDRAGEPLGRPAAAALGHGVAGRRAARAAFGRGDRGGGGAREAGRR